MSSDTEPIQGLELHMNGKVVKEDYRWVRSESYRDCRVALNGKNGRVFITQMTDLEQGGIWSIDFNGLMLAAG